MLDKKNFVDAAFINLVSIFSERIGASKFIFEGLYIPLKIYCISLDSPAPSGGGGVLLSIQNGQLVQTYSTAQTGRGAL